jgi:hypothetical protein
LSPQRGRREAPYIHRSGRRSCTSKSISILPSLTSTANLSSNFHYYSEVSTGIYEGFASRSGLCPLFSVLPTLCSLLNLSRLRERQKCRWYIEDSRYTRCNVSFLLSVSVSADGLFCALGILKFLIDQCLISASLTPRAFHFF